MERIYTAQHGKIHSPRILPQTPNLPTSLLRSPALCPASSSDMVSLSPPNLLIYPAQNLIANNMHTHTRKLEREVTEELVKDKF